MERPILFKAEMVRAILEGRKTVVRRAIKPQPSRHHWEGISTGHAFQKKLLKTGEGLFVRFSHQLNGIEDGVEWIKCPYGQPGDTLYVREAWAVVDTSSGLTVWYPADNEQLLCEVIREQYVKYSGSNFSDRKRPSIHMPRWASRLTLKITDIRVERLQDISEEDAEAEGPPMMDADGVGYGSSLIAFMSLWDRINFKRGYGWGRNPWVWCVSFEMVEGNHG